MSSFLKQLTDLWTRLKFGQRVTIIVAVVGTLALMATLIIYGTQPEFGVLFSDLKPADAQTIVEKLKTQNVQYKLTNNGTVVSVPADRVSELRLEMASSGALAGGHVGFDIFDRASFGATEFTQQVNYKRAIEGELAKTLEGLDEVESARVHVTQPHESIYADKAERSKASVMGPDEARSRTEPRKDRSSCKSDRQRGRRSRSRRYSRDGHSGAPALQFGAWRREWRRATMRAPLVRISR